MQKGQFPKCCDLCETEIKIKWKCVNCNLLMCNKCKEKVHSKFKSADKHNIVDIKEVGQNSRELDLSILDCEDHDGQTCVMFCASCDQLVCPQCIAAVHNGHGLVQIVEGYKIQIENAQEIQQQIKISIEELTNGESKIKLLRKYENSKYIETRNMIHTQNAALKREVDEYSEKLLKELDEKWINVQNSIDKEENKVMAMKTRKEDQSKQVENIINSNDADKVFKESKCMGKFLTEAIEPVKLDLTTIPKFIAGKITEYHFGSLQDTPKDLVPNTSQQFTTDFNRVFHLSSCPDNSLWISDSDAIQRVKPEVSNLKVMSNFNIRVYSMELTPSNDLLLVTEEPSRLKQIKSCSTQVTDSVYSVDSLRITTVHVTQDYKVMVGARTPGPKYIPTGRQVVIRMSKEGEHEKTYEHDRNKQQIFTYPRQIACTANSTLFVIDWSSDSGIGRVVVLGQDGDVLNIYTGDPKINSDHKPFKPVYVVTTPLDKNYCN